MDEIIRRIADHVANEGTAGVLAIIAKRERKRVRDLEPELQDQILAVLRKKFHFHLPRQISLAQVEQLQPREPGERDTLPTDVDPYDRLESSMKLPDGVARDSRPMKKRPR